MSHSRESCQVEEETKWQPQWRISKMEIDSVPRQLFPIGNLKHFLTSDASSSSMTLSLAVLLWLAWVGLVARVDQRRSALHLESRLDKHRTQDCPRCGCANEYFPHRSRARCVCMEVSGVDVWSVPLPVAVWCRALSPNCVHTRCRPVTTTSCSRDESGRNFLISERHKFFLICFGSV